MVHRAGALPSGCRSCRGMDVVFALWSPTLAFLMTTSVSSSSTSRGRGRQGKEEESVGKVSELGPRPLQPDRRRDTPPGKSSPCFWAWGAGGGVAVSLDLYTQAPER